METSHRIWSHLFKGVVVFYLLWAMIVPVLIDTNAFGITTLASSVKSKTQDLFHSDATYITQLSRVTDFIFPLLGLDDQFEILQNSSFDSIEMRSTNESKYMSEQQRNISENSGIWELFSPISSYLDYFTEAVLRQINEADSYRNIASTVFR